MHVQVIDKVESNVHIVIIASFVTSTSLQEHVEKHFGTVKNFEIKRSGSHYYLHRERAWRAYKSQDERSKLWRFVISIEKLHFIYNIF